MGYEKVGAAFNETWKYQKKGDSIEGIYQGSKEVKTSFGEQTVHTLGVDGKDIDIWGTGKLNYLMQGDKLKQQKSFLHHLMNLLLKNNYFVQP